MTTGTKPTGTKPKLIAFHGDPAIKAKYLGRVAAHRRLDRLVPGATGKNGKGCAVWCTLNKYEHASYETKLGIPTVLAYLEDSIFENLPHADAMNWPEAFLSAIRPGADLSKIAAQIVIWQWEDPVYGMMSIQEVKDDVELCKVCGDVVVLYRREMDGGTVTRREWEVVYEMARAGARERAGARSGAGAWALSWAEAGAWALSWAEAVAWAWVGALARSGAGAGAWAGAWALSRVGDYKALSEKVLELLAAAPVA